MIDSPKSDTTSDWANYPHTLYGIISMAVLGLRRGDFSETKVENNGKRLLFQQLPLFSESK
jgi:hypothetical protein